MCGPYFSLVWMIEVLDERHMPANTCLECLDADQKTTQCMQSCHECSCNLVMNALAEMILVRTLHQVWQS